MTAATADQLAKGVLSVAEFVDKPLISRRFFDGREIDALNVFDQRDLQRLGVVEVADKNGNASNFRFLRRPPTPFTRDDFVGPGGLL